LEPEKGSKLIIFLFCLGGIAYFFYTASLLKIILVLSFVTVSFILLIWFIFTHKPIEKEEKKKSEPLEKIFFLENHFEKKDAISWIRELNDAGRLCLNNSWGVRRNPGNIKLSASLSTNSIEYRQQIKEKYVKFKLDDIEECITYLERFAYPGRLLLGIKIAVPNEIEEQDDDEDDEEEEYVERKKKANKKKKIKLVRKIDPKEKEFAYLTDEDRRRDLYIIGGKQSGKSTLILNLARQDIEQGRGVAIIDPHGDLVENLLPHIPEERIEDTIYFDPSDTKYPIPFNIFNAQDENEAATLADDLLVTFRRLSDTWGERMDDILRHTIHTLSQVPGATFLDIQTILQNPEYRAKVLSQINSQPLLDFWQYRFPQLAKDATQPILSRMSKFSLSPVLKNILGSSNTAFDISSLIQKKKIFLANLGKGRIGEDTSKLLGSLLVSQFQLAIMRRANIPKEQREYYFLYVDEFQNFTSSAFDTILSEAGKYKLSLTLAHQYISQLDEKMKHSILGNIGTMIMLPLGHADAQQLRHQLGKFKPEDVANLDSSLHEGFCKPLTGAKDTFKFKTLAAPRAIHRHTENIIDHSRDTYSLVQSKALPLKKLPPELATMTYNHISSYDYDAKPVAITQEINEPLSLSHNPRPKKEAMSYATKKEFSHKERALYFIRIANYLSTKQLKKICYSHVAENARANMASRDLGDLIGEKKIKSRLFRKEKIYYTGSTCEPTTHNLAIRDLFIKILFSNYEIADVDFLRDLKGLKPDLFVSFVAKDGTLVKTFWEYDTGTEGIAELITKVKRYEPHSRDHLITFVLANSKRLALLRKSIPEPFIIFVSMEDFQTLDDCAFHSSKQGESLPFFL
jgi:hypothetical protein